MDDGSIEARNFIRPDKQKSHNDNSPR